ncbi:MAG TPA: DEAD/DEAH box helicase [Candidatus Merdenecus merdavium]|nr:DEAD/DEAH box helicase [Candidatus Merdenecus merdavium]
MEDIKFSDLGLSSQIMRAVEEMGFQTASPIQAQAIPYQLEGLDVIGQAQTGTGKTAAFGIPLLEKVDPKNKNLQAIILCPTRELAIQVAEEMRKLAKFMHGIKTLSIYGGQDITKQIRGLKSGVNIVIGTPGRVMDHMRRRTLKLDQVHTIILDEADEMLNMGFREDIETILTDIPKDRQTILFSATMPRPIMDITKKFQKNAKVIKVVKKELTVSNIDQYYFEVRPKNKDEVLSRLLDIYEPKLSLVFCNTKRKVDELVLALQERGYFAEGLHGDLKQSQRDRVMNGFRHGKTSILVATDVAARGIDVDDVEAVFNYDIPQDEEYYVHRIGRTGRAGRTGQAFSFVVGREIIKLREIQKYCKTKIELKKVPGLKDVTNKKLTKVLDQVDNKIQDENLEAMIQILENQVEDKDYSIMDVAAAFLKMSLGEEREEKEPVSRGFEQTGAKDGMVRFFLNIGRKQNTKPGDILGAIAGETGIKGKLVGAIDVYDKYSFVEVPKEYAKDVLYGMENAKIKGKSVNIEIANRK